MRIGSLREAQAQFYTLKPLKWVDDLTILGIKLGTTQVLATNYIGIIDKMKQITTVWSNRILNLMGKVTVCNSLLLSIPVYKLLMVSVPDRKFFKEVQQIIREFLWDSKPPKKRYTKLVQSKWAGGLALADLESKNVALKASWVPRLLKAPKESWAVLAYEELPLSNEIIWDCNISPKKFQHYLILPNFGFKCGILGHT